MALLRALEPLTKLKGANEDQNHGITIARRAMEEPLRQIASNAGGEASVVVNRVKEGTGNFGFNAQTDEFGDLIKMGILAPTKVVRTALRNAASIAGLLITTECSVCEAPKKDDAGGMPGGMDGMM